MKKSLTAIRAVFSALAGEHDYSVIDAGTERHGGYIWLASRAESHFTRTVDVTVSPEADGEIAVPVLVEFWIGADDGEHFGRYLERSERLTSWTGVPTLVEHHSKKLFFAADGLGRAELVRSYSEP